MAALSLSVVAPCADPSPRVSPLTLPATDPQAKVAKTYGDAVKAALLPIPAFGALDTDVPIPSLQRHKAVIDLSDSQSPTRQPHYVISTIDANGKRTTRVVPIDFSDMKNPTAKASVRNAERIVVQAAKCECGKPHDNTAQNRELYRQNYIRVKRYINPNQKPKARRLTNLK